mmetsp:Transcript_69554/g.208796  ORF Transcript_69554/g.208796 Transcript_69554/m.208796 type:complete len:412 (-) Transcript_69554:101-1336(-)
MVTKFHRRFGRRRRQAAFPIQMGLILFAAVVLCVLAFVNRNEDPDFDSPTFDFRLGSRRLKPSNKETLGSGESELRWDNWFSLDQMRSGGVIMHVLIMLYMFDGLAIVCDEYFCASLDEIVIKLDLSDDVAGATFMAAGGSAPEFFTSLIGVFFMESSVGFGTIIGSAVFNVLFVIGICAYFSGFDTLPLTWYPLARDSSYYLLCLGTLLAVSNDREIHWYEAMILCLLYVGYVVIMMFDPQIRKWAMKNLDRSTSAQPHRPSSLNQVVPAGSDATSATNGAQTGNTEEKFSVANKADAENGGKEEEEEEEAVVDVEATIALYQSALVNKPLSVAECAQLQADLDALVGQLHPVLLALEPLAPLVPRLGDFSARLAHAQGSRAPYASELLLEEEAILAAIREATGNENETG